ncbi:MAG TPA: response regulator [Polyangiaceae bacterium]|nr:response regulator [Polyangiaceae bacterium]
MSRSESRVHILVVEDDLDLRDSLIEVLEEAGYVAAGAEDGREALRQLSLMRRLPDLILLDLQMPNMNGMEFRDEQKKVGALAQIPIAVVSADPDASEKARAIEARALLRKPLKVSQLLTIIPQVVGAASAGERLE